MNSLQFISRWVRTDDEHATVDRLFVSRHVKDLQLLVKAAALAVMVFICLGPPLSIYTQMVTTWKTTEPHSPWTFLAMGLTGLANFLYVLGPVLAVFGGVLAWAYQVGSARLGVVDLFACEISTLCRITTVLDTVQRLENKFDLCVPASSGGDSAAPALQFTSQENYFPVFDSSGHDLQTLEAQVVINITAFYTYMKAMRDGTRALATISPPVAAAGSSQTSDEAARPWREGIRNVVYLMYLGLESARKSLDDLVEFEPERVERIVVLLISELAGYGFLRRQFTDPGDSRHQRILLRDPEYRVLIPQLCDCIEASYAAETAADPTKPSRALTVSQWLPAWLLLPELRKRYDAAVGNTAP